MRANRKKFKVTFQIPFKHQILETFNTNLCETFITTTRKRAMNQFRKKYGHGVRIIDVVETNEKVVEVSYCNTNLVW